MLPFVSQWPGRTAFVVAAMCWVAGTAVAQRADVVFEPTPHETVTRMLDLARVGASDMVIDLGSGDGRIAIAAARRGARALGIEINPDLVAKARAAAASAGVKATFRQEDLFRVPLSEATVITLYLLPELNVRLRPLILALKPGTRVVSHQFPMGDWKPDEADDEGGRVMLWLVPPNVAGRWQLQHGEDRIVLDLRQQYQELTGSALIGSSVTSLSGARLRGREIEFVVELRGRATRFRGTVDGNAMQGAGGGFGLGTLASGWRASRL